MTGLINTDYPAVAHTVSILLKDSHDQVQWRSTVNARSFHFETIIALYLLPFALQLTFGFISTLEWND